MIDLPALSTNFSSEFCHSLFSPNFVHPVFKQLQPRKFKCSWTFTRCRLVQLTNILKDHSASMYNVKHLDSLTL
jgi:hypothetical protein